MRVGFLFNHYLTYQVPHGASVAFELSRIQPDFQTELLFSTTEARDEAVRIASAYPHHQCKFLLLRQGGIPNWFSTRLPFLHRPFVLMANLKSLASYDALIAPEKNCLILKALPSFRATRFIGLCHGAGDRPRSFSKSRLKFNYLLVPGQSYYKQLKDELPEGCCQIVGYPKFEVLQKLKSEAPPLFNDDRPIVLYAPHFHRRQSSWISMGRKILAFFKASTDYNLIFAPHIRMFKHRRYHDNIDLDDFREVPNILIDTGSQRSIDMSYTQAADIYLGDVSSQVCEFIYHQRRPCVFLNPNGLEASTMNFWQLGPVIDKIDDLETVLASAHHEFEEKFRPKQDVFIDAAFALADRPPSERGAEAISRFLKPLRT